MSSKDTRQFRERKAWVEQALKGQRKTWKDHYDGVSTINILVSDTGLNEQAVKRIVKDMEREGRIEVVPDRSTLILLKKK